MLAGAFDLLEDPNRRVPAGGILCVRLGVLKLDELVDLASAPFGNNAGFKLPNVGVPL